MTTSVTRQQFFTAVAQLGSMSTLYAAVDADPGSAVWIEFYSAAYVVRDDVLSVLTQTTFGWTDGQMDTLFATAAGTSGTPISNTLGAMRVRIANEISRSDLTDEIALAISDAIALYQPERFYFNETNANGLQFTTVDNQETYDKNDLASLEYIYDVDDVFVVVGVNRYRVKRIDPTTFNINRMPYFKGQPYQYMWNNRQFSFSPIPNAAYTMIVLCQYKIAAPASDSEADNPWMIDAERMIRSCAKRLLYQDILLDGEAASACQMAEEEAFYKLRNMSNTMSRTGSIDPMRF